jgi:hypothetical protein
MRSQTQYRPVGTFEFRQVIYGLLQRTEKLLRRVATVEYAVRGRFNRRYATG